MTVRGLWPVLLAAGIGLSFWQWYEASEAPIAQDGRTHGGQTHRHEDSGKPTRLYAWDAAQAMQITLATPESTLTLKRGAQGWTASPQDSMQRFDAVDFVALLSQARSDRELTPHADQSYGLNPPQLRIDVHDGAGVPLARLDVGALAPDGLGRYVQLPDEAQIRIIPDYQTRAPLAAMHQGNPASESPRLPVSQSIVTLGLHKNE